MMVVIWWWRPYDDEHILIILVALPVFTTQNNYLQTGFLSYVIKCWTSSSVKGFGGWTQWQGGGRGAKGVKDWGVILLAFHAHSEHYAQHALCMMHTTIRVKLHHFNQVNRETWSSIAECKIHSCFYVYVCTCVPICVRVYVWTYVHMYKAYYSKIQGMHSVHNMLCRIFH